MIDEKNASAPDGSSAAALWPCFRCEPTVLQPPPNSPPEWVPPTMRLCPRHDPARVASGRLLSEVLDSRNVCRRGDRRVEWLFNPVLVEGERAWFSLALGTFRVLGETFPSDDPFEYFVQHNPQTAAELLSLHKHRDVFAAGANPRSLKAYFAARDGKVRKPVSDDENEDLDEDEEEDEAGASPLAWFRRLWAGRQKPAAGGVSTRFERLCRYWSYRKEFQALRDKVDPGRTLREEALIDHARRFEFPWQAPPSQMPLDAVIKDLLRLAARRYGP